jgi:hypothetical protein
MISNAFGNTQFGPCFAVIMGMGISDSYQRRKPEESVLYKVVQNNLATFHENAETRGQIIPRFVKQEFESFLDCGILAKGFVRVACQECKKEHVVAFSCKNRGWCPSCGGRRMNERAAFLVDYVFPRAPVRQWVLSLPIRLRYLMAYNAKLCAEILNIFIRQIERWYRFCAKAELALDSVSQAQCGSVTFIQRFDSALRLNVHFHAAFLDGIYFEDDGVVEFFAMPNPSDEDVAKVAIDIRRKTFELLEQNGLEFEDPYSYDESQLYLAQLSQASIKNMAADGSRAGLPTQRLYAFPEMANVDFTSTRCANINGFSLHANVRIKSSQRKKLEKLCRYIARAPISNDRLHQLPDGRIKYDLKRPWSDGSTSFVFEPQEFLARLVPLVPPPRVNQVRFHGVFAPNASLRPFVVPQNVSERDSGRPKNYCWSELMRRAFEFDVLVCPSCGGQMKLIASIMDRETIAAILNCVGYPADSPEPSPSQTEQYLIEYEYNTDDDYIDAA